MKIVIDINHPAHVHKFRNLIDLMIKKGHEILITASDKDITYDLLDLYNLDYIKIGSYGKSLTNKIINVPYMDFKMYNAVKKFKPDVYLGVGSIRAAQVSRILNKISISLDDTELATEGRLLYKPFTNIIITPKWYNKDLGQKQIRINAFFELSYLHPTYFKPNPSILDELNIDKNDIYFILRFVSFNAFHDIGQHGIKNKYDLINKMEKIGKIFISSEYKLNEKLEKYRVKISPIKIFDLMYFSKMYIGESGSMATESSILGVPSIYISSLGKLLANFTELENKYSLLYSYVNYNKSYEKIFEIIEDTDSKKKWNLKREYLLKNTIDPNKFLINLIEKMVTK